MEFINLYVLCCLLSVLWETRCALTLSPEEYWKSELPNTPIPKRIKDIIPSDGNLGVIGKVGINIGFDRARMHQEYKYFIKYITNEVINDGAKSKPSQRPAFYFFLEQDLQKGKTMTLSFPKSTNLATFLPRHVAKSIPFSSDKIIEILNRFGIKPDSVEAKEANETIRACNDWPKIKEEKRTCVTSLESMVDLVKAEIGIDVESISSKMCGQNRVQNYTIIGDVKRITKEEKERVLSCHKRNYVYSVFYCHVIERTMAYVVPLVGEDKTKIDAVAICHRETSGMSPGFWAFRVLGTKPGTTFCHFLPQDHILFYN